MGTVGKKSTPWNRYLIGKKPRNPVLAAECCARLDLSKSKLFFIAAKFSLTYLCKYFHELNSNCSIKSVKLVIEVNIYRFTNESSFLNLLYA